MNAARLHLDCAERYGEYTAVYYEGTSVHQPRAAAAGRAAGGGPARERHSPGR
jgi:hypothetical protein